jgi:nitrite reductase/ring-hydroxylating ferredoxin subunit
MLTKEENELLIRIGPGTPMGNLLRRYWTPFLLSSDLEEPDGAPVRVKILGEELLAFRDTNGRVGLIDEHCPHRGTSLFFGRNEECGIRCVYHGWKYDVTGQCVDMPSEPEDSTFKDRLQVKSYPVRESGGVLWTYMGPPEKMTGFRDFGTEHLPREQWSTYKIHAQMNWMQGIEGLIDPAHTSWLHMWGGAKDLPDDGSDRPGAYNSGMSQWRFWAHDRRPRTEVMDTWHGWHGASFRTTPNGHTLAAPTSFIIPYAAGPQERAWTVPIDDDTCWYFHFVTVDILRCDPLLVGGRRRDGFGVKLNDWPYDDDDVVRNKENDYAIDRARQKSGDIFSGIGGNFLNQDLMAMQSSFKDRSQEHLASLDRLLIKTREVLLNAARNLEKGIDPPALDPELPYDTIGSPRKVLHPGEDWRTLGTEDDPVLSRVRAGEAAEKFLLPAAP